MSNDTTQEKTFNDEMSEYFDKFPQQRFESRLAQFLDLLLTAHRTKDGKYQKRTMYWIESEARGLQSALKEQEVESPAVTPLEPHEAAAMRIGLHLVDMARMQMSAADFAKLLACADLTQLAQEIDLTPFVSSLLVIE